MASKSAVPEATQKLPDYRAALGHDAALAQWRKLAAAGRLPSVLLLTGRAGIGKRLLLAALTAMQVCAAASACGDCDGCRMALSGAHPEILWLANDGASIGVEEAGRLQEHLALCPGSGSRYRIAVVEDCDRFTVPAANRLLKLLEEPPPSARILLSSARPGALLATIRSRCVRWRLAPPMASEAMDIITRICAERGVEAPGAEALSGLLKVAGGAPGAVLAHLEAGTGAPSLTWPRSRAEAIDWGQGARGVSVADTLAALEIKLNAVYQSGSEQHNDWPLVAKRRALIASVRKASAHGKVAVNAQLLAESVGLVGIV